MSEKRIMLGNEAFARGAYEAGVGVVSSYPGTPSTEITEFAATYDSMHVEWATNEKVSVEVAFGASLGGVRALSAMKHVGLNVAADPLFTVAYTGVNAGLVLIVADDAGCHSSQNEQDSRFYARAAGVPMLEPASAAECLEYVKLAYEMSEAYDTPVLIRSNTRISHSRGIVPVGERVEREVKPYEKNVPKYVAMPANAVKLHMAQEARLLQLKEDLNDSPLNTVEMGDTKIGIITSGICYQYVKEALPEASVLKLGAVYPLPMKAIYTFAKTVDELYVIEEGEAFIETAVRAAGIRADGKELFGIQGEYSAMRIRAAFGKEAAEVVDAPIDVPARPPLLCAGCPHRGAFYVLNQLKKTVMGDIGCYTLGATPPLLAMDSTICMGASIPMAHGMEMARGAEFAKDVVAVIGDSTFFHSGLTGLANMRYNGATGTVLILDNRTTGMTGHQNNPATGKSAKGTPAPEISIPAIVQAMGISHVVVVDPLDLDAMKDAIEAACEREELSVVIGKRACQLIVRDVKPPYQVNENCRKCGMCMGIGCPAIEREGKDVEIISERCVGCGLCAQVCPFDAIEAGGIHE